MDRRTAALVAAAALTLSACGTTRSVAGASVSSSATTTAPSAVSSVPAPARNTVVVPADLAEAKQAWAEASARQKSYEISVRRRCQTCELDSSYAIVDGPSVKVDKDSTRGLPRTVEQLFSFIERAQSGSGDVRVVYDRRGVPLWIGVDPDPQAKDDESTLEVGFAGAPAALLPPGTDGWVRAADKDFQQAMGRAAWIGADDRLYLLIGGSGSCPPEPGLLTPVTFAGASGPELFLVDDTERAGGGGDAPTDENAMCSMDLKSYLFSTATPAAVSASPGSSMPLVMFESGDAERVMSWMATPD